MSTMSRREGLPVPCGRLRMREEGPSVIGGHGSPFHLEEEAHLNARTLPTGERWEVVIRRAAEIPPEFLELVEEMGRGYGYLTRMPGARFSSNDGRVPERQPRLVVHVYGRTLLERLLAAARRTLPHSSVGVRRMR